MAKENITRIKIPKDGGKPKKVEGKTTKVVTKTEAATTEQPKKKSHKRPSLGFMRRFFGYFAGAWRELREVRWPSRKTTWSYTLAVILFSIAMAVFIILLDLGLNELRRKVLSS